MISWVSSLVIPRCSSVLANKYGSTTNHGRDMQHIGIEITHSDIIPYLCNCCDIYLIWYGRKCCHLIISWASSLLMPSSSSVLASKKGSTTNLLYASLQRKGHLKYRNRNHTFWYNTTFMQLLYPLSPCTSFMNSRPWSLTMRRGAPYM